MGEQYFMAFFSYLDQMQFMNDEQFGRVFRAAMVYAQSGKMPEMDPLEMTAFMFIKWNIDKTNEKKAQTSEARSKAAGAKWSKSDANECKPMQSDAKDMQTDAKTCKDMQRHADGMQTDANDHMKKKKEEEKEEKEDITISNEIVSARAKRNRIPPDPDDVRAFVAEHGLNIDADAFVDYYAAQGWKLSNGVMMKDWQAAVRRWSRNEASPRAAPAETEDRDPMLAYLDSIINGGEEDNGHDKGGDGGNHQGPEDGLSGFLFPLQSG